MKTINKVLSIAMMGVLSSGFTSCTDGNDWDTDGSTSRLFGVIDSKVSVETERDANKDFANVTATVNFPGPKGAEYYIVEVSTDSLHDGVALRATENSIVYGEDKSITKTPAYLAGLEEDTKYYLRIKGKSSSLAESKWVYYNDGKSFRSVAEQIFNEITEHDRLETSIHVSWTPDERVGFIAVKGKDEEGRIIMLSDADRAACEYTIEDLTPGTAYVITIWNGTPEATGKKRGTLHVTTAPPMPEGDFLYVMTDEDVLNQDLINMVAEQAKANAGNENAYSATIGIPAEKVYEVSGLSETGEITGVSLPEGFSVTFFGRAGGEAPVLNFPKSFNMEGTHAYIRFEKIKFFDAGCQYFINQSKACNIVELSFKNCEFTDFDRSLVRTQGSEEIILSNIVVDNCILTNMAKGNGYSVFYFGTASTTIGKLELKNSTFNTSQRSFIESSKAPIANGIFITDCTFYNNVATDRYLIDSNKQNTDITFTRTILGKTFTADKSRGIRTAGKMVFQECLRASDCVYGSNDIKELEPSDMKSKDIFTDPDKGNFTLKILDQIGDPRWYKK